MQEKRPRKSREVSGESGESGESGVSGASGEVQHAMDTYIGIGPRPQDPRAGTGMAKGKKDVLDEGRLGNEMQRGAYAAAAAGAFLQVVALHQHLHVPARTSFEPDLQ
jgi:hypothetical protein